MKRRSLGKAVSLIPTSCMVCNKVVHRVRGLCACCEAQLPWMKQYCHGCGMEFEGVALQNMRCGQCVVKKSPLDGCHALFHYGSPVDKLIHLFKFHARFDVGECLAQLLAQKMHNYYLETEKPDLILPVPLHTRRYLQRGFNQSWELCKTICRHNAMPGSNHILQKRKHTPPQADLKNAAARARNLNTAFTLTENRLLENVKRVTIVDDVITTRSTVSQLARVLKAHGIQRVEAWCIARAGSVSG